MDTFNIKDISKIDMNNTFFHYTAKNNLSTIIKNGLEPRIGKNSLYVEKSKKVFFSQGEKGILTLMDVWLRWLTAKCGISNQIYYLGTFYMRMPLCIKSIPNYVVRKFLKNKNKRIKVFNQLKNILDNSVFLILDLKENVDFSYNDIDRQGYIYVLTITVINPDVDKTEAKKSQRIVVKENNFNDFVLSFQVI